MPPVSHPRFRKAQALVAERRFDAALSALRPLLAKKRPAPAALLLGARAALGGERIAASRRYLRALAAADLPAPPVASELLGLLEAAALWQTADRFLDRLLARAPHDAVLHGRRARIQAARGALEEAERSFARALELDPAHPDAWLYRARASVPAAEADDPAAALEALERVDDRADAPAARALRRFARGHLLARLEEHEAAFQAFDEANRLYRLERVDFGVNRKIAAAPGFVRDFGPELLSGLREEGHPSPRPVLITGMPRSGTTLVEQVIAAHPAAASVGERRFLGALLAETARGEGAAGSLREALVARGLQPLGEAYLGRVRELLGEPPARVVDKLPFNFALAAPAHAIFPRSTIIDVRRDRFDVCWSMFTTPLRSPTMRFTLPEIGRLTALKEFLMGHWAAVLPEGALVPVAYEDLVTAFEHRAPAVVAATGLEWTDACRDFHLGDRAVATASVLQVRRPLYADALGRSRPFRRWLEPFEAAYRQTRERLQAALP